MTESTGNKRRRWLIAGGGSFVALFGLAVYGSWWLRAHGLTAGEALQELRQTEPRYEWQSIDKKHWQAVSTSEEAPEITDAREGNSGGCPTGMVRIKGTFHQELHGQSTGEIERLQDAACTDWISKEFPARCRTFDKDKIAHELAKLPAKSVDYCIDRFEYPNILGKNPMIVVTFREAEALCKKSQKRLCTENEWTWACEGEEARPYPYGYTRDTTACVIDRPWRPFAENGLQPRDGQKAREELDRLWQGEPSGSRAGCKSPFGVYDMTGNVDEWTRTVNKTGYSSILKGGYWGPVRARCRPSTRAHNEDFVAYQQSFRCCADSQSEVPAPVPAVATTPDAGPLPTSLFGDAGARASTDQTPEWGHHEDDDEIDAITKTRVGLGCALTSTTDLRDADGGLSIGAALAVVLSMRRRAVSRDRARS